jgi:Zn-dependent protease/predicted transcriptional regulator
MHSVRIGNVFGIELRADWSIVVIFWLLMWQFATIALPAIAPGYTTLEYWATAFVATALFIATLAAHEVGHSITAQRRGLRVRDITLWMLGGVATLEGEAQTPADDLAIAVAGPATSVTIGLLGLALGVAAAALALPELVVAGAIWIATINLVIALFNLAPAAPLDGGRILRAWLWKRSGDRSDAAIKATHAGRWFAWLLMAVGFVEFALGGAIGGLWLIVLGWFVFGAARSEEQHVFLERTLGGVRVRDVMTPHPVTAPDSISVAELVRDFVMRSHGSAFPLTGRDGQIVGLVSLSRCKTVPPARRELVRAVDIADPLERVTTATPDELVLDVLQRATTQPVRVLVFDRDELVGIVTPTDVMRIVQRAPLRTPEPTRGAA